MTTETCPSCGRPAKSQWTTMRVLGATVAATVLFVVAALMVCP